MDRSAKQKILAVEDLPTLPTVITRILEIVEDADSSASDLTEILEMDPAITVRVLRLANSAFFGLRHKVDTIRRAVVVIGFEAVRLLSLATSAFGAFSGKGKRALDVRDFWMHSFGTAKAAQFLSQRRGLVESPAACFTAGLLHDMGKLVLDTACKEQYEEVVRAAHDKGRPLVEFEKQMLGTTHAQAGAWLAEHWHLPVVIVDAIGSVYQPDEYAGPYKAEVQIVALAEILSQAAGFGSGGEPVKREADAALLRGVGVDESMLPDYVDELALFRDDAHSLLDMLSED